MFMYYIFFLEKKLTLKKCHLAAITTGFEFHITAKQQRTMSCHTPLAVFNTPAYLKNEKWVNDI